MKLDLSTVLLLGVAGFLVYQWRRADVPSVTEAGHSAFWNSSFGDLAELGLDAWGSRWNKPFDPYSAEEAARIDEVAENLNNQVGYKAGSWGAL